MSKALENAIGCYEHHTAGYGGEEDAEQAQVDLNSLTTRITALEEGLRDLQHTFIGAAENACDMLTDECSNTPTHGYIEAMNEAATLTKALLSDPNATPPAKVTEVPGYWWCPNCKEELGGNRVTNQEKCDTCGYSVDWIEPHTLTGQPPAKGELRFWIHDEGVTAGHPTFPFKTHLMDAEGDTIIHIIGRFSTLEHAKTECRAWADKAKLTAVFTEEES